MDCQRFRRLVQSYWDTDLEPASVRTMDLHAMRCPGCASELADAGTLFEALRHLERDVAPAGFEAAVLTRVDCRRFKPTPWRRVQAVVSRSETTLPGAVQMALAALLLAGLLYAGAGRMGGLTNVLLRGLGAAATWVYTWITVAVTENVMRFVDAEWPLVRSTAATLGNAVRLLVVLHLEVVSCFLLGIAALGACTGAWRRGRGRRSGLLGA